MAPWPTYRSRPAHCTQRGRTEEEAGDAWGGTPDRKLWSSRLPTGGDASNLAVRHLLTLFSYLPPESSPPRVDDGHAQAVGRARVIRLQRAGDRPDHATPPARVSGHSRRLATGHGHSRPAHPASLARVRRRGR